MNKEKMVEFDKSVYNMFEESITCTTLDGTIIDCNKAFLKFIGKSRKSIIGKNELKLLNLKFNDLRKNKLLKKQKLSFEEVITLSGHETTFFKTKKRLINKSTVLTIRKNVTHEKTTFVIYKEYKRLLQQIATGKSLVAILDSLVKSIEKKNSNMLCSVLLLDKSGQRLFAGSAPSLPDFYMKKLDGMEVGEKVGSCGAAVHLKKRVVVEDILEHENWKLAKNLAIKANLRACWSQPIFSSKEEVLGTFAIYYSTPKKPTKIDLLIIKDAASIAGIAIEKFKNEYQLNRNYENEKKQEQLLMHKSKQAMMGEMLENIAHQWRQPLSAITTASTGIQLKRELGHDDLIEENDALDNININAQYLSQTIEDFRNYFKSDNKFVKFNIKDSFSHTLKLVNARIKNDNIHVFEKCEDIMIFSLNNELTQVFMNILNNSIDELEKNQKDSRIICVKIKKNNNEAIIKINDSAGGAKSEIINRIFEPYFTTKHQSQGTGIGLYMCKEIIEKHINGTIEARNNSFIYKNNEYKGLEFLITIPIL